jgi:tetratricopeptide (TPR) repeat protein
MLYNWLSARLMERAVRRCNFDGALKLIRGLHFYHPEGAGALRMRGYVLMLAGRYREAEDTLRRAIARFREGFEQAAALECLGDALMEQGRYDDAMRSYEAALHAAPGFRVPYRRMAEWPWSTPSGSTIERGCLGATGASAAGFRTTTGR